MTETRLPSKKTGNGRHTQEIRGPDLYPTPAVLTEALLQVEDLPKTIWEPAAGMGHMTEVLKKAGHKVFASDKYSYGTDGVFIQDFFDFKRAPQGASCIVTNVPFSIGGEFVRHGLELCEKVVTLGRLAFLEAQERADVLDYKLARVYPFVERPPMLHRWSPGLYEPCKCNYSKACPDCGGHGAVLVEQDGIYREWAGKKSTSAMPFAWFCFERNHDASKGTILRRIWWSKPERNVPPDPRKALFDLGREEGKLVLT
jgi:hypothetical protein